MDPKDELAREEEAEERLAIQIDKAMLICTNCTHCSLFPCTNCMADRPCQARGCFCGDLEKTY